MTPQTVNAVNLPLQNALNFPAAILQPPFFDPDSPAVVNYGAIGTIIGHEISHTFDEEGSDFDSKGRVRNWWTAADRTHFDEAAVNLEKQYDAYELFPGVHVNGKQTINENIADLGGLPPRMKPTVPRCTVRKRPHKTASREISSSSSPSRRTGVRSFAKRCSATRFSPIPTLPRSSAPTSFATPTRGTKPSTSSRATNSIWLPANA